MWTCPKCGPVGDAVLHGEDEEMHCMECDSPAHILPLEVRHPKKKSPRQWNASTAKKTEDNDE